MNAAVHEHLYTGLRPASDLVYAEIKSWILLGELPLGRRLGEERIAERLSVSRTPVREALLRLFGERFLERHPEGGFRVANPTGRSIRQLYEVRRALELFAVRRAVEEPTPAGQTLLTELRADWAALEPDAPDTDPDFVLLDEDFHRRLAEASGNSELVEQLRRVGERIRPARTHDFVAPGRIKTTITQHLEIVGAVIDQSSTAEQLLERHILESQRNVEAVVGAVLERMLESGKEGW
jgi:DNA-binding GntR family transcriptional regulator